SEAQASRNSRYLDGIGKMVSYGITGSMVAAAASPALVRGLVDGIGVKAVQRMAMETGLQMGTSLIFNGNLEGVDLADIGFAGVFGKYAFFSQSIVDYRTGPGLSSTFGFLGNEKSVFATSIDLFTAGFNTGHSSLMNKSKIDQNVINVINGFNGTLRVLVGETMLLSKE
ncbi:MAG: hypothetical protein WD426_09130, partial [Anditalea sp.]